MELVRQELTEGKLHDDVRATALRIVDWVDGLSFELAQFITVRRVIDQIEPNVDDQSVLAALYVLTQLSTPVLSRGVYWTDDVGVIREMEPDLYAEALTTGVLAHPDYGTEHTDFFEWVEPFFWLIETDTKGKKQRA